MTLLFPRMLLRKSLHDAVQLVLCFETDTGEIRQSDVTIVDSEAVRESAKRLKNTWVGFIAAEAETGRDVERHLVAAMWNAAGGRPARIPQHFEDAQIFHQAVTQRAIKLQNITIGSQSRVANQVARVLHGEKVLAGGHGPGIVVRELGLEFVVEGIAGFLVPAKPKRSKGVRIVDG